MGICAVEQTDIPITYTSYNKMHDAKTTASSRNCLIPPLLLWPNRATGAMMRRLVCGKVKLTSKMLSLTLTCIQYVNLLKRVYLHRLADLLAQKKRQTRQCRCLSYAQVPTSLRKSSCCIVHLESTRQETTWPAAFRSSFAPLAGWDCRAS
jgi:hypothetical protein